MADQNEHSFEYLDAAGLNHLLRELETTYLKLTGGTLTGSLSLASKDAQNNSTTGKHLTWANTQILGSGAQGNSSSILFSDRTYLGDADAGILGIKAKTGTTAGIAFSSASSLIGVLVCLNGTLKYGASTSNYKFQVDTNGYVTAEKFVKNNGTSAQFLKADGSVDSNTYLKSSDVQAWAKAASKPTYSLDEVADGTNRKLSDYLKLDGSSVMIGDLKLGSSNPSIVWSDGTVRQRIKITDDSQQNTKVFSFQQSLNSGSDWSDLLSIYDNGKVYALGYVVDGITNAADHGLLKSDGTIDKSTYVTATGAVASLTGGEQGAIPYQSQAGVTAFLSPSGASNGYVLAYNTTTHAPYWKDATLVDVKVRSYNLSYGERPLLASYTALGSMAAGASGNMQYASYYASHNINNSPTVDLATGRVKAKELMSVGVVIATGFKVPNDISATNLTFKTGFLKADGTVDTTTYLNSADIAEWAKAATAPTYTLDNVADGSTRKLSDYLKKTDISSWAKAATKPSYQFSDLTNHPTTLSGYGITDGLALSLDGSGDAQIVKATATDTTIGAKAYNKFIYFTGSNGDYNLKAGKFITANSSNQYVVLGDGTTKLISELEPQSYVASLDFVASVEGGDGLVRVVNNNGTIDKVDLSHQHSFLELIDRPTTLAGYGITDAYISGGTIYLGKSSLVPLTSYTETDPTVPAWAKASVKPSYTLDEVSDGSTRKLSNYQLRVQQMGAQRTPVFISAAGVFSECDSYPTTLPASDVYAWAKSASKPSYNLDEVVDGSTRKLSNYQPLVNALGGLRKPVYVSEDGKFSECDSYPTTLPASDVYAWAKFASKPSYNFMELTSHPTTLEGYGITDAYTKEQTDELVRLVDAEAVGQGFKLKKQDDSWIILDLSHQHSFLELIDRPTTLAGYGITDIADWALASSKPSYTLDEVSDGTTRKLSNYLKTTDIAAWAKSASKPSYQFSEIGGEASASQIPTINNIRSFSTYVYSAQQTRTVSTVLAAPSNSDGVASFRTLVSSDIPDLSEIYYTVSNASALDYVNNVTRVNDVVRFSTNKGSDFDVDLSHQHSWVELEGRPTTIKGFGIEDAYTKIQVDSKDRIKSFSLQSEGSLGYYNQSDVLSFIDLSHQHSFLELIDRPTTLAGYGITDAYISGGTIYLGKSSLVVNTGQYSLPLASSTLRGGVQIGYNSSDDDRNYAVELSGEKMFVHVPWVNTTYDVTEYLATVSHASEILEFTTNKAAKYSVDLSHQHSFLELIDRPTTLAGYGITDAYTITLATTSTLGGIKIGYSSNGNNYAVQLDNGRAYVNVPWTDTSYSLPLATASLRGGIQVGYTTTGKNYAVKLSGEHAYVNVPWTDTWTAWVGASQSVNGVAGYMPAATIAQRNQFLRGDGTWCDLNNYSLPLATASLRGGIQVGYTTTGKNYAVKLSGEHAYVNVPWTDHYDWSDITNKPDTATRWPSWEEVTSKPTTFTPSSHSHDNLVSTTTTTYTGISYHAGGDGVQNGTTARGWGIPEEATADYQYKNVQILRLSWISNSYSTDILTSPNAHGSTGLFYRQLVNGSYATPTGSVHGGWRMILDKCNSSVTKSGSTLTVNIGGTSQSITNTWRSMENNLTTSSSDTSSSLSAYQGYLLANGSARDSTKVLKAGDTMTGMLTVKSPIFAYEYNVNSDNAAIIMDKPGSNYTGIGANGVTNQVHFGPCSNTGSWLTTPAQTWDFFGSVKSQYAKTKYGIEFWGGNADDNDTSYIDPGDENYDLEFGQGQNWRNINFYTDGYVSLPGQTKFRDGTYGRTYYTNFTSTNTSTTYYYPYFFYRKMNSDDMSPYYYQGQAYDIEIFQDSQSGSASYNSNYIHFVATTSGWSDHPKTLNIVNYQRYTNTEITIGGIAFTTGASKGIVVWLRGGLVWNIKCNCNVRRVTTTTSTTESVYQVDTGTANLSSGSKVTAGTSYFGCMNGPAPYWTQMNAMWSPNIQGHGGYINTSFVVGGEVISANDVTAYGSLNITSDRALKNNIKPLEWRGALKPVQYDKKVGDSWHKSMGFIAQDVQVIYPELVHKANDYLTLDYNALTAILAYQTNKHESEIDKLKKTVKKQSKQIADLQKQMKLLNN